MKITVYRQILSGNLGVGQAMAEEFGNFLKKAWLADLAKIIAEGHEVKVNVDVQDGEGDDGDVSVEVSPYDENIDAAWDLKNWAEAVLTPEDQIWKRFYESDESTQYINK